MAVILINTFSSFNQYLHQIEKSFDL